MKHESMSAAAFLERATELRAIASELADLKTRDVLVGAAEEYERMAYSVRSRVEPADSSK